MAGVVRQSGVVEVQVIGAGALNQAVKAIAIARGYVAPSGVDLVCIPTFADIEIDGEGRTAIRLAVEDRGRRQSSEEHPAAPAAAAPTPPPQRNGTYRPLYPTTHTAVPPVLTT